MSDKKWQKFIRSAKIKYYEIGDVSCPVFDYEKVYFNKKGFSHIINKGKSVRNKSDQLRRINLLPFVSEILKSSRVFGYKVNIIAGYSAHFWTFKKSIGKMNIRVIVRQLGNGRKHFFSVMSE